MTAEQPRPPRSIWRWMLRGVGALMALVLLVALAWLASNVVDANPAPRPAELARQPPLVPDADNAAYALIGLFAAADRDPAVAGRVSFQAHAAYLALPAQQRQLPEQALRWPAATSAAEGTRLANWAGPPVRCVSQIDGCAGVWIEQAGPLARQREAMRVLGQRCEALLDGGFQFEEPMPLPRRAMRDSFPSHLQGAQACSTWFATGAVQAWQEGHAERAVAQLKRADRLMRALLNGSHSTSAQILALRFDQHLVQAMTTLALRDANLAVAIAPLLQQLPQQAQNARRWLVYEASNLTVAIDETVESCAAGSAVSQGPQANGGDWMRFVALYDGFCRHPVTHLPHHTQQWADRAWLMPLQALADGDWLVAQQLLKQPGGSSPAWRNTFGGLTLHLLKGVSMPVFAGYLQHHIDADLRREAGALAVAAHLQAVPAGQREAWSQRQPMSEAFRQRLRWVEGGQTLLLERAEPLWPGSSPSPTPDPRNSIRISWPR